MTGPKPWLSENRAEFTFLTTESLVESVIEGALQKLWARGHAGRRLITKFALDQVPPIYPVKIPVQFNRRAAADRHDGNRISALAAEIAADNNYGLVIADGVEGVEPVLTFQGMKGQNGFASMDISIILTCSNPEKFAELNAIGQWLGMKDVIDLYYDDQLNQAVRAEEQRVGRYGHARVRSQTLIVRQDENKFVCGYRRISGGDRQNSVC